MQTIAVGAKTIRCRLTCFAFTLSIRFPPSIRFLTNHIPNRIKTASTKSVTPKQADKLPKYDLAA